MKDKLDAKNMSIQAWEKLRRASGVTQDDVLKSRPLRETDRHFIQSQPLKEAKGVSWAYEQWMNRHERIKRKGNLGDRFDFITEDVRANPDSLREDEAMYANSQMSKPQELMGLAAEHLQGRQREVYLLTMRDGMSIAEAAKELGIAKGTAQTHRTRAINFVAQFCKTVLAKEKP